MNNIQQDINTILSGTYEDVVNMVKKYDLKNASFNRSLNGLYTILLTRCKELGIDYNYE